MVEVRDKYKDDAIMVGTSKGQPIIKATKCDLCIDQLGGPSCQRACPHDALVRMDMSDTDALEKYLRR